MKTTEQIEIEKMIKNLGKNAILKPLKLFRSEDPMDHFYVTIVKIYDSKTYVVIADRRNRQFLIKKSFLLIE